jgi:hypothetical protein
MSHLPTTANPLTASLAALGARVTGTTTITTTRGFRVWMAVQA